MPQNKDIKENIVKKVCRDYKMTYKELAEAIGYSEGAIKTAVSTNKVSEPMNKAINLYIEKLKLEEELKDFKNFKNIIKKIIEDN